MKRRARPSRRAAYRRYDQAMAGSMRLAAAPRRREWRQAEAREVNWPRVTSASIVGAMIVASLWIGLGDTFYVMRPTLIGSLRVPAASIVAGSHIAGLHVMWINANAAEAALRQAVPQLESARVSCTLPANCSIGVAEREPLLVWRWGQAVVWIDRAGVAFPAQGDAPDLLTVDSIDTPAPVPGQTIDSMLMSAIVSAAAALPEVRQYRYSTAHGLEFDAANRTPVYLGVGANMADRVTVWRALYDSLGQRGIQPAYIDVRFPLAPYYGK